VNLYGFAGDNPVNEMDPSGLDPWWVRLGHWWMGTTNIKPLGVNRGDEGLDGNDAGGNSSQILSPLAQHPQQARQQFRAGLNQVAGIVVGSVASAPLGGEDDVAIVPSEDYNQARNKALQWLQQRGFRAARTVPGKFGPNKGRAIGMMTADGNVGFRVEYDKDGIGAHINVFDYNARKLGKLRRIPHFTFPGSQNLVNKIVGRFNR
jgi:hypothetical protein